ncbi:hypothetical protein SISSUDRAFT_1065836 [Sistotremastrum suecicum HHB10207 ss-3]|uniref:Uncharacterized protein n=1 Tax=Sistotremastrum suecicum HHB10207 ss-3 TaxID=1314776 RepID=A0A165Z0J1_9AGAM|nr:hypothetical protein SISSUDRAFT_1065836 [Sistotremastrum suecicum HHB10207 ss-3]
MSNRTVNRPIALHHSALSALEFCAFIPDLFDIFEVDTPAPGDAVNAMEANLVNNALEPRELRGWLKGRHRKALRFADLNTVMEIVVGSLQLAEGLKAKNVLAAFRLVAHCLHPGPKIIVRDLVWIPSKPSLSLWRPRTQVHVHIPTPTFRGPSPIPASWTPPPFHDHLHRPAEPIRSSAPPAEFGRGHHRAPVATLQSPIFSEMTNVFPGHFAESEARNADQSSVTDEWTASMTDELTQTASQTASSDAEFSADPGSGSGSGSEGRPHKRRRLATVRSSGN